MLINYLSNDIQICLDHSDLGWHLSFINSFLRASGKYFFNYLVSKKQIFFCTSPKNPPKSKNRKALLFASKAKIDVFWNVFKPIMDCSKLSTAFTIWCIENCIFSTYKTVRINCGVENWAQICLKGSSSPRDTKLCVWKLMVNFFFNLFTRSNYLKSVLR